MANPLSSLRKCLHATLNAMKYRNWLMLSHRATNIASNWLSCETALAETHCWSRIEDIDRTMSLPTDGQGRIAIGSNIYTSRTQTESDRTTDIVSVQTDAHTHHRVESSWLTIVSPIHVYFFLELNEGMWKPFFFFSFLEDSRSSVSAEAYSDGINHTICPEQKENSKNFLWAIPLGPQVGRSITQKTHPGLRNGKGGNSLKLHNRCA